MIRFVVGPDRMLVPDLTAKLPGRGMWLSARADVLETAQKRGAFARAARGAVQLPPDLCSDLRDGLLRRISELLGLARRAGQAVAGFQKARERLRTGKVGVLVEAADGSAAEKARLLSGIESGSGEQDRVPPGDACEVKGVRVVTPLSAAALGTVFGRDHVVHVAVAPGRLAEALVIEWKRLSGLVGQPKSGSDTGQGMTKKRTGA